MPDNGLGEEVHIGLCGPQRLDYLKKHKRVLYMSLLTSGKPRAHLHEIAQAVNDRRWFITKQMAKRVQRERFPLFYAFNAIMIPQIKEFYKPLSPAEKGKRMYFRAVFAFVKKGR